MTEMAPADLRVSASWATGPTPDVSVHIATYGRATFLPELVDRLEAQTLDARRFDVVIVDDGSGDDTWSTLTDRANRSRLRLALLRLGKNRGPAAARNAGVRLTRAELVAFTDDDCLPSPTWLAELLAATEGADIVQGVTEPDPSGTGTGPWARTIRIVEPTPLFETCNIVYRRSAFDQVGGFDEDHAIAGRSGRHTFGEDALLGAAVVAAGGRRRFASAALVHHRYLRATFGDHLRSMWKLAGFPALTLESAVLADALWARAFLTARTASFDLAVVGVAMAGATRQPVLLVTVVPWVVLTWPMTREHGGRPVLVRLAQLALADAVGAAALVVGSVRHRRLVL